MAYEIRIYLLIALSVTFDMYTVPIWRINTNIFSDNFEFYRGYVFNMFNTTLIRVLKMCTFYIHVCDADTSFMLVSWLYN